MNIVQVYKRFPTHEDCLRHLEDVRWHGNPICPYCKSDNVTPMPKELRHHCNNCNTSFRVTVQTIFHNTKLDLQKWFVAISIVLNAKKGISARQLARDIEVNKDTAWYMGMRIRKAMGAQEERDLLQGICEADETYIGGKNKGGKRGRGSENKIPVAGIVERGGDIVAKPVKSVSAKVLNRFVKQNIDCKNTILVTDDFRSYIPMSKYVEHRVIKHSEKKYADGMIHTNTIESFWSLFKRGIAGQYHHLSTRHLKKYLDEFCYRQNNRHCDDLFEMTLSKAVGC